MAQQVQVQSNGQAGRVRSESPERWQKALERALEHGIEIFTVTGTTQLMATSATHLDRLYPVSATTCACPAAAGGDPVCLHRAAVRSILGQLPESPAAPAECMWCSGSGLVPNHYHERYDVCESCGGSGLTPERRPQGLPAVQPVATEQPVAA